MQTMGNKFAAFILTHGRPDRVKTYRSLREQGYTGPIVLVCDDQDERLPEYLDRYGDEVVVFDKAKEAETTDRADNLQGLGTVLFARNACFKIAKELGYTHFVQLDDDYRRFEWRFDSRYNYIFCTEGWAGTEIRNLDGVFAALVRFLDASQAETVCMTQTGDFMGGKNGSNPYCKSVQALRKVMNSFVCNTSRPFDFVGRGNDDVNTYVTRGRIGKLMFSTTQVSLSPSMTQQTAGGLTEMYLEMGTYTKSFYTVMMNPSSTWVRPVGNKNLRLHHGIRWRATVPKIVREDLRKPPIRDA